MRQRERRPQERRGGRERRHGLIRRLDSRRMIRLADSHGQRVRQRLRQRRKRIGRRLRFAILLFAIHPRQCRHVEADREMMLLAQLVEQFLDRDRLAVAEIQTGRLGEQALQFACGRKSVPRVLRRQPARSPSIWTPQRRARSQWAPKPSAPRAPPPVHRRGPRRSPRNKRPYKANSEPWSSLLELATLNETAESPFFPTADMQVNLTLAPNVRLLAPLGRQSHRLVTNPAVPKTFR